MPFPPMPFPPMGVGFFRSVIPFHSRARTPAVGTALRHPSYGLLPATEERPLPFPQKMEYPAS